MRKTLLCGYMTDLKRSNNDASLAVADHQNWKPVAFIACLALAAATANFTPLLAAPGEGVALAIVYDTSGSMKDPVADSSGKATPKYVIANRALMAVAAQIQNYATNQSGTPKKVEAGLFTFSGSNARAAIPFGEFDAAAIQNWAQDFSNP